MSGLSIAKSLELHLLRPSLTHDEVLDACQRAAALHLAAVVVWPVHVQRAASVLAGTDTRVSAAVGFPFGQETLPARLVAIEQAQSDGADETVVMLDHSSLLSGRTRQVAREVERLGASMVFQSLTNTRARGQLTIAVETTLLDPSQHDELWARLADGPIGFVQTGGGLQGGAVTEAHVQRLRGALPPAVAVKATGGVASLADAQLLLAAGAVRVGSASAIAIVQQERAATVGGLT